MISKIIISDIDFYVSSMNVDVIIVISLTRFNFYNFTLLIIKDTLAEIVKKASFYLYSNNI